jgi:rod shape determining protein RodA
MSVLSARGGGYSGRASRRRSWLFQVDWILWGVPLALTLLAGILIASTQRQADYADWYHHWITAAVGMALAVGISNIQLQRLRVLQWPIYALTMASLIAVRVVGTSALGAQRWISVGGFHVQPSEFAKLAAILLLAGVLSRYPVERPVDLLRPMGVIALPWALVFLQPDLGSSLVFGAILLVMLYWAGMPLAWVLLLLSPIVTAIVAGVQPWGLLLWMPLTGLLAWRALPWKRIALAVVIVIQGAFALLTPLLWTQGLKDYQRDRLVLFLDPSQDPLGGGYHLLQSKVGIGSGGLWGTGLMQGLLTKLRFIPEQHTDFIFSAAGEETGFLGATLIVCAFALLCWRLLRIAGRAATDVESLVVVGVGAMVMFQVVVNIFMTIGLGTGDGDSPAVAQLRTLGPAGELHGDRPLRVGGPPWPDGTTMVVNLQGLRDLLAEGVPAGKGDEDNVRRQWWAALATVQEDLLLASGPEPGVWLAAPLPALYEPSLLRCLVGLGLGPREIDRLFQPGAPQLPGTSGFPAAPRPRRNPWTPVGAISAWCSGSDDGTDPLLVVITPGLQVGLAMEGPAGGRRLLVRFEAHVLRRALELLDRRLQKEDPAAAQDNSAAGSRTSARSTTTPPWARGSGPCWPNASRPWPPASPCNPWWEPLVATGHRIPSAPSWPCWRRSPMRCAPRWPPSGP